MAFARGAGRPGYEWRARRREEQQQRGVVEDTLANAQARRAQMKTRFDAGSPRAQQVMQPRMDQMQDRIDRLQGRLDEGQGADRLGYGWRADRRAAKDAGLYPEDEMGDEMAMSGSGGNQGAPGMPRDTMSNYPSRRDSVVSYKNALRGTYGPNGQQQMIGVVPPSGVSAEQAARIQQRMANRFGGGPGAPGADMAMIPNGQITGPAVEQTLAQNGLAGPMAPPAPNAAPAGGAAYSGAPGAPGAAPSAMQQVGSNPSITPQQPLAPPYTNGQQQPGMPGKGGQPAGLMPGL